jgi:hypothetical protein
MERLDDADLGTPGPLVHTLESWPGRYETLFMDSVKRKPLPLTVWMVNRILNAHPPKSEQWLELLRRSQIHPLASASTKLDVARFLEHQAKRGAAAR